jgi:hypothetical protein
MPKNTGKESAVTDHSHTAATRSQTAASEARYDGSQVDRLRVFGVERGGPLLQATWITRDHATSFLRPLQGSI